LIGLFDFYSVFGNRYGGCIHPDVDGYDDASANYDFHAVQNIAFCSGGWLESYYSEPGVYNSCIIQI
jgi:hypothetical protein